MYVSTGDLLFLIAFCYCAGVFTFYSGLKLSRSHNQG